MDLISVHGGSPAGRQPAIRGISSSRRACKHTNTHTYTQQTPTFSQLEWKVLSVATNGPCFSSPNSLDAPSAVRHLLSFTFSPAAAALALSSPLWFSVISPSVSGLHYLHLLPLPSLSLSCSLSLITTHYLFVGG